MEELILQSGGQPKTSVWDDYVPVITEGRHTDIYLLESIDAPSEYAKACRVLETAFHGDTITLHINNGGGYVDSGFMLIDAINTTKATVTAKLTGTVASVSTIITLACSKIVVAPYIQFMIHNYSGGAAGKGHEIKAQMDFSDAELNRAFGEIYGGFLTDHEMELVIAGKDLWMGKDEVLARWGFRGKKDTKGLEEFVASKKAK